MIRWCESQLEKMKEMIGEKRTLLQQQLNDIEITLMELNAADQRCDEALEQLQN